MSRNLLLHDTEGPHVRLSVGSTAPETTLHEAACGSGCDGGSWSTVSWLTLSEAWTASEVSRVQRTEPCRYASLFYQAERGSKCSPGALGRLGDYFRAGIGDVEGVMSSSSGRGFQVRSHSSGPICSGINIVEGHLPPPAVWYSACPFAEQSVCITCFAWSGLQRSVDPSETLKPSSFCPPPLPLARTTSCQNNEQTAAPHGRSFGGLRRGTLRLRLGSGPLPTFGGLRIASAVRTHPPPLARTTTKFQKLRKQHLQ